MSCLPDVAETTLTNFFELDKVGPIAGNLLYFFERYSALIELVIFFCVNLLLTNFKRIIILI